MKNKQIVIIIIINVQKIIIIMIIINNVVMNIIIIIVNHHLNNIKDNRHHLIIIMNEHFSIVVVMVYLNKLFLFEVIVLHVSLVSWGFFLYPFFKIPILRYTRFKFKTYSIKMSFTWYCCCSSSKWQWLCWLYIICLSNTSS